MGIEVVCPLSPQRISCRWAAPRPVVTALPAPSAHVVLSGEAYYLAVVGSHRSPQKQHRSRIEDPMNTYRPP